MSLPAWMRFVGMLLIGVIVSCLCLGVSPSLAQSPSAQQGENSLEQPEVEPVFPAPSQNKSVTDNASQLPSSSTRSQQQHKTYEQPPHPYDMEAIEAYDEAVYGEGR